MAPHSLLLATSLVTTIFFLLVLSPSRVHSTVLTTATTPHPQTLLPQLDNTLPPLAPKTCVSRNQPNPIISTYPNNVTGVLNVTLIIIPIPLADARALIPSKYAILESAYRTALPSFPRDHYPLLVQAGHDHDIYLTGYSVPDFTRAGFEFPYIDLLGDGYSPFRWAPEQLIQASNPIAIAGSRAYGTIVHPASFDPPCDAYGSTVYPRDNSYLIGTSTPATAAISMDPSKFLLLSVAPLTAPSVSSFPLHFYRALLNQPTFADGSTCDSMIRLFDTTLTTGSFAPVEVRGDVVSNIGPFTGTAAFRQVHGLQVASAFIENNYLNCHTAYSYLDGDHE